MEDQQTETGPADDNPAVSEAQTTGGAQPAGISVGRAAALIAGALAAVLLIVGIGIWAMQERLVYGADTAAEAARPGWKATKLDLADGAATAYQHPGQPDAPTMLFLHGAGYGYAGAVTATREFANAGMNVIVVEYPGRAGNPGRQGIEGMTAAAREAMRWIARNGVAPDKVIIYGEGVGAGPAIAAATMPHHSLLIVSGVIDPGAAVSERSPFVPAALIRSPDPTEVLRTLHSVKGRVTVVGAPGEIAYGQTEAMAKATGTSVISVPYVGRLAFDPGLQRSLAQSLLRR